jgi:hypothetical protein
MIPLCPKLRQKIIGRFFKDKSPCNDHPTDDAALPPTHKAMTPPQCVAFEFDRSVLSLVLCDDRREIFHGSFDDGNSTKEECLQFHGLEGQFALARLLLYAEKVRT